MCFCMFSLSREFKQENSARDGIETLCININKETILKNRNFIDENSVKLAKIMDDLKQMQLMIDTNTQAHEDLGIH